MKTKNRNKLVDLFNNTRYLNEYVCLNDVLNYNDISTPEELEEFLNERILEIEVIYYLNAINILKEEDQSLMESLEQAYELGYTITDVNSGLLASVLIQKRCFDESYDFIEEVRKEEIFEEN